METPPTNQRIITWRQMRRALVTAAVIVTLGAVFYAEENWRGQRAWENCKRDLEAKGANFEWSAYVPPAIPDDQNIFQAPKMTEWFVRKGWSANLGREPGELSKRLGATSPSEFVHRSNAVAEITILVSSDMSAPPASDLLLEFSGHVLSLADSNSISRKGETIPVIKFENIPVSVAITNLAHQAGLNFILDPKVFARWRDESGRSVEPNLSITWENLTAHEALLALLETYHLAWVEDPKSGIARVVVLNSSGPKVILQAVAEERLKTVLQEALDRSIPSSPTPELSDIRRRRFIAGPLPEIKTLRLAVVADRVPTAVEVEGFLPHSVKLGGRLGWRAVATGSNTFNVFFIEETFYSAAEYLAWSYQFEPEFAIIREALRRPQAQIAGDYQRPFSLPIPDFVCVRNIAQLLAERAQCFLVLGKPEHALRELTLLHDLRRMLRGKPTLLVAAMIDVAVAGLYTSVVADGFALHAWREPELVALQKQLAEIRLPATVVDSLRTEGAATSHTLLQLNPTEIIELLRLDETKSSPWAKFTDPAWLLFKFAPRGWIYQNLVAVAHAGQATTIGTFDAKTGMIYPGKVTEGNRAVENMMKHWGPYMILARITVPNFSRALQTTARNQTLANEAFIACALERHRAARGAYPDSLDALVPTFSDAVPRDLIGGKPLHYRREADGQFTLYSIGWNESDDGGQVVTTTGPSVDFAKGDWVWQTPSK